MAAFGTKVVVLMMVLPSLVLLLQTSSVQAVDILIYGEDNCVGNAATGCAGIQEDVCCSITGAAAVEIVNLQDGQSASFYSGDNCTAVFKSIDGPYDSFCFSNTSIFGAAWFNSTA